MRPVLLVALVCGAVIGYVDSRPTWDDTGVTVGVIALVCGLLGAVAPDRPWLWAVAVGGWVPAFDWLCNGNLESLAAVGVAFVAAYVGMAVGLGVRAGPESDRPAGRAG